jgi:hypothetical protein
MRRGGPEVGPAFSSFIMKSVPRCGPVTFGIEKGMQSVDNGGRQGSASNPVLKAAAHAGTTSTLFDQAFPHLSAWERAAG